MNIIQKFKEFFTPTKVKELEEKVNKIQGVDIPKSPCIIEVKLISKILYNVNTKNITIILYNGNVLSSIVEKDVYEKIRNCNDESLILELISPPRIEEKNGSDFDIDVERIITPLINILSTNDNFEIEGDKVYLKGIKSIAIPSSIVAEFIRLQTKLDNYADWNNDIEAQGLWKEFAEEFNALLMFTYKLLLNPLEHSREDLIEFIKQNDIKISKNGNLILYRNIVKTGKTNKKLVEFISNQYFKVKSWKKSPKNYEIYDDNDLILVQNHKKHDYNNHIGNLKDLYNNISELKENTYTSWHNKGRYTIKIGSLYKIDENIEELNTTRYACQGGALHAVNFNYDYSYFGDTKVVVLVNPSKILTIPSNDSGKITTREMWVACYNPNELGVHFDETGLSHIEDEYENYSLLELKDSLINKSLKNISLKDFDNLLNLSDIRTITKVLSDRIIKV